MSRRPPIKKAKILKFCSLTEMEIFEDMIKIHAGKTRHAVMKIAQVQMPSIFLPRSRLETFQGFPDSIARKKAAIVAAEAKAALARARKKARRLKLKGRAPTMEEKKEEMEELFVGESNHQVVPSHVFIALAMMLFAQYKAGVPMSDSIDLPFIIAFFRSQELHGLLHSQQTSALVEVGQVREADARLVGIEEAAAA